MYNKYYKGDSISNKPRFSYVIVRHYLGMCKIVDLFIDKLFDGNIISDTNACFMYKIYQSCNWLPVTEKESRKGNT